MCVSFVAVLLLVLGRAVRCGEGTTVDESSGLWGWGEEWV